LRPLIVALVLGLAAPAFAQTAPQQSDLAQVARMLGALWRPLPPPAPGQQRVAAQTACLGALEELEAVNSVLPEDLNSPALNAVRATRGFVIVNSADEGGAFFFPSSDLTFIAPGRGSFVIADRAQGLVNLTDAAGAVTQVQLGASGGLPMMRIMRPNAQPLVYVGCASTAAGSEPAGGG